MPPPHASPPATGEAQDEDRAAYGKRGRVPDPIIVDVSSFDSALYKAATMDPAGHHAQAVLVDLTSDGVIDQITRADMARLAPGMWLNDTIIEAYMLLLQVW